MKQLRNSALADAHILLVSERHDQVQSLQRALRDAGCRISAGFDGLQGYQRAVANLPDLILMGVQLPRMDGFAACRLLAADPQTSVIPVMFLTERNCVSERIEAFEVGGVDYVAQPFAVAEVLARVRIHLNRVHSERCTYAMARSSDFSRNDLIVRVAMKHFSNTLEDPPTIAELANAVGTSEKRLSRAFIESVGKTVYQYLRDERLRLAQRLLCDTALSVTSVAEEVGFSSGANFATAFRERFGMTPSTYRNQFRVSQVPSGLTHDKNIAEPGALH
jgi:DNA-binding response OmpR family regulator